VPKYLIKASYSPEGIKGLLREGGSSRKAAVDRVVASLGGSVEAFYFGFGDTDAYIIAEVPDAVTAAALAATVGASGALSKYETVPLLSCEDIDAAAQMTVDYRAPGA
jgi:uncharacterized protein with GYD domain